MDLPVMPPVVPMLALARSGLPLGDFVYEPKWDGFRCIAFRDGDAVELASRSERSLTRYFPEVAAALAGAQALPAKVVLDGEIVIAGAAGLDFDALLQRIHPADSRVRSLAASTPASFVAFDVLAAGREDLRERACRERRSRLVSIMQAAAPPLHVTPATDDPEIAGAWFDRFEGAGLDGVVAKPGGEPYREGRRIMLKVKHRRSADVVVAGFRWHASGGVVGSLLLGLFDGAGRLHHVGIAASFAGERRRELVGELAPYRLSPGDEHPWLGEDSGGVVPMALAVPGGASPASADDPGRAAPPGVRRPGGPSRWSAGRSLAWEPLRPQLVCEVAYDHLQGDRFRHATRFLRWRPDRSSETCTYDQLEAVVPEELGQVFKAVGTSA